MSMQQVITPNPHIPCQPGWCLQYVRQAFGLPARHPTATAAWEASTSKHRDRNFPAGVWLPVWFSLVNEPAGHVALMAPDGTVFSTSDLGTVPHQHLDLSDLMNYYARYGMTLKYLGWTEDVAGYPVLSDPGSAAIGSQGSTKPQEDELSAADVQEIKEYVHALLIGGYNSAGEARPGIADVINKIDGRTDRYLDAPVSAVPEKTWSQTVTRGGKQISVKQELADSKSLAEKAAGTLAAQVAIAQGSGLTADQITAAVKAALSDATATLDFDGGK